MEQIPARFHTYRLSSHCPLARVTVRSRNDRTIPGLAVAIGLAGRAWQRPKWSKYQPVSTRTDCRVTAPGINFIPVGSQCGGRATLTSYQCRKTVDRHRGRRFPTRQLSNFLTPEQQTTSPQYTLGTPPRPAVLGISGNAEHTFFRASQNR